MHDDQHGRRGYGVADLEPGETITLPFVIWDTGGQDYDSSVLLDHLRWLPAAPSSAVTGPAQ